MTCSKPRGRFVQKPTGRRGLASLARNASRNDPPGLLRTREEQQPGRPLRQRSKLVTVTLQESARRRRSCLATEIRPRHVRGRLDATDSRPGKR
jgi:hypothetical protein